MEREDAVGQEDDAWDGCALQSEDGDEEVAADEPDDNDLPLGTLLPLPLGHVLGQSRCRHRMCWCRSAPSPLHSC